MRRPSRARSFTASAGLAAAFLVASIACAEERTPTSPGCQNIEGRFTLTVVAAPSCQGLPAAAKSRSYAVVIAQPGPGCHVSGAFQGKGALPGSSLSGTVAGQTVTLDLDVSEDLGAGAIYHAKGHAVCAISPSTIDGPLDGTVDAGSASCPAADHRLTLARN